MNIYRTQIRFDTISQSYKVSGLISQDITLVLISSLRYFPLARVLRFALASLLPLFS